MATEQRCACCRGYFKHPKEIKRYGEHYLCNDCIKAETKCDHCDKKRYKKRETIGYGTICMECTNKIYREQQLNRYTRCGKCGRYHFTDGHDYNEQIAYGCCDHWTNAYDGMCDECLEETKQWDEPEDIDGCYFCGDTTRGQEIKGEHRFYCVNCVPDPEQVEFCGHCHEYPLLPGNTHYTTDEYGKICPDCHAQLYKRCQYCEKVDKTENMHKLGGEVPTNTMPAVARLMGRQTLYVCKDCVKHIAPCHDCGEKALLYPCGKDGKKKLCFNCKGAYKKCPECGVYMNDVLNTHHGTGCGDCRHKNGWGVQRRYDWRPAKFNFLGVGDVYFGIENEMGLKDNHPIEKYQDHIARCFHPDVAYTQYDGTIRYGTEVVFHPMTFNKVKSFDFSPLFDPDLVYPNDKTCGMHVHISRTAFNKLHLYKFMRFITTNPELVELVAGREGTLKPDGRGRAKCGFEFTRGEYLFEKAKGVPVDHHKYIDVNLTHGKTVELRIFKGADSQEELVRNVEFCQALVSFTKSATNSDLAALPFFEFVMQDSRFPFLQDYLRQHDTEIIRMIPNEIRKRKPMTYNKPIGAAF